MQRLFAFSLLVAAACGSKNPVGDDDTDAGFTPDACVGIDCQVVDCSLGQKPPTSISGQVFAPNGTLPLFGINVYIPREDPGAFVEGAVCDKCSASLPGNPIAQTVTDENGNFVLNANVPAGDNIQVIVTTGKWRRKHTIARVNSCTDNPVDKEAIRLPKTKAEGDIPKIALTTGSADSLECLVRKLGIDDTEITNATGTGRVHYYAGNGKSAFDATYPGAVGSGTAISSATPFWATVDSLKPYDIVFLSCEGGQRATGSGGTKPQAALDAMKAYADLGGRVFASHWHNVWVGGNFQQQNPTTVAPPVWQNLATWTASDGNPGNTILIDEVSNPKGSSFATWMENVGGSTVRGQIGLTSGTGRRTALTLDATNAERWVQTAANEPQMFQLTTPQEQPKDTRCGKVVFTDMHVTGTASAATPFPSGCPGGAADMTLTAQEKALAFMFFDIASCVGGVF